MDLCVHNCRNPKYKLDLERYWLIKTFLKKKVGKDITNIILILIFKNSNTKYKRPLLTRCIKCNKYCHVAYCYRKILGNGIDYCEYHNFMITGYIK